MASRPPAFSTFSLNINHHQLPIGPVCGPIGEQIMQVFETTHVQEARRCRYVQFAARRAQLTIAGVTVTGIVHSVLEDASSEPKKWIIKIVSK